MGPARDRARIDRLDDLVDLGWFPLDGLPELAFERDYRIISTKLLAGRLSIRVYSDTRPGPDFEPAEANLEDVYFATMTARGEAEVVAAGGLTASTAGEATS